MITESITTKSTELAALVSRHTDGKPDGLHSTAIDGLELTRESSVSTLLHAVAEPMLAIVVQGKKGALLGGTVYHYGASQYLVLSVDLPIVGFITEATPARPYLGFKLNLDPRQFCDLMAAAPSLQVKDRETSVKGFFVSTADDALLDCALRLTRLLDTPQDIPILAPIIIREIHYRLSIGEQSEAVRQIATSDSNMDRIATVLRKIKTDFATPLRVEDLAGQARMSPSSFYHHFKQVTSMSPLQYQKQLRLLEARRLMLAENYTAIAAAERVGYESPSQFSREYARLFGAPPARNIDSLRAIDIS
jgi:AraC-like DNA-binding protein